MTSRVLIGAMLGALLAGCSTGEGEGSITSDRLYAKNCWDGAFDLGPNFFATIPFQDTQQIRIQRGDRPVEVSDGALLVVNDVSQIRSAQLAQPIQLGLPVGVRPPGFPLRVEPNPPQVSVSLYLYETCHLQNSALYSVSGTITFDSLFSGDRNETSADNRLTRAHFDAMVADPRDAQLVTDPTTGVITADYTQARPSAVHGEFQFYFQRGVPAQPFP